VCLSMKSEDAKGDCDGAVRNRDEKLHLRECGVGGTEDHRSTYTRTSKWPNQTICGVWSQTVQTGGVTKLTDSGSQHNI